MAGLRWAAVAATAAVAAASAGPAGAAAAGDAGHGAQVFAAKCAMCHGPAGGGAVGPAITGVVGRKAASTGFAYSPALKRAGWSWDAARLDKYLTDPQAAAPGTSMPIGLPSPKDRADVIALLTGWGAKPAAAPARAKGGRG